MISKDFSLAERRVSEGLVARIGMQRRNERKFVAVYYLAQKRVAAQAKSKK
jgi:hypothetical protein